jgi:hypothetical protein
MVARQTNIRLPIRPSGTGTLYARYRYRQHYLEMHPNLADPEHFKKVKAFVQWTEKCYQKIPNNE